MCLAPLVASGVTTALATTPVTVENTAHTSTQDRSFTVSANSAVSAKTTDPASTVGQVTINPLNVAIDPLNVRY